MAVPCLSSAVPVGRGERLTEGGPAVLQPHLGRMPSALGEVSLPCDTWHSRGERELSGEGMSAPKLLSLQAWLLPIQENKEKSAILKGEHNTAASETNLQIKKQPKIQNMNNTMKTLKIMKDVEKFMSNRKVAFL